MTLHLLMKRTRLSPHCEEDEAIRARLEAEFGEGGEAKEHQRIEPVGPRTQWHVNRAKPHVPNMGLIL